MNFNKLTISDLVDQQLPSFVAEEFPTFVKFFEEYYKSLEVSGGILDIQNNFLEYKNVDNLQKFNLVRRYILQTAIDESATSIVVDKIDGLSTDGGIIGIGSEIIQYETVNISTRTLTGCKRGFTATTQFDNQKTTVRTSNAQSHAAGAAVLNYSNLILFFILKNYEEQYLAGFPHENISDQIGKDTLIRNIKDFYSYKGTDLSVQFLFRALFNEEITIRYPKDRVIKSSYSDWTVDDIIKVEEIQGNPYSLVGSQIRQTDATGVTQTQAIIDDLLVNNISNYASGSKNIYELRLNVLDNQPFTIPNTTILRRDISATDTVITVDSTLSFPAVNGIIEIDGETITYRTKTINQFIDCGRGTYDTNATAHSTNADVRTTEFIFGYPAGKGEESDQVKMRVLGLLSEVNVRDGSNYFEDGEKIKLSADGASDSRVQFTSWQLNEVGRLSSSSDIQVNAAVKNTPTETFSVFKDNNYAYVTSAGLPRHPIGAFGGVGFDIRNQHILKSIPLESEKSTREEFTSNLPVGLFINGVEAFSPQDYEEISFGEIASVSILENGIGFEENIQPLFRISNPTGNGATFSAKVVDGRVTSISVVDGGQNYTTDHDLEVTYGFDATASIAQDAHLVNGEIKTITVGNPGQDYVATPSVEITDLSGRGKGAFAIAEVTNNQVTGITVLNGGTDYTDRSEIRVRIVSKGTGVFARANVKKWAFDRVFKTKNAPAANGNFAAAPVVRSDTGNGYLYPSRNAAYGLQYGYPSNPRILRHDLQDNVLGVNTNYAEKPSGFTHSPILGWAYDGNPIYGPYGYSNPVDATSGIVRQTSSYGLKTTASATRPSVTKYPLGAFVDDYEFNQGSGSLDFSNGRFCKTPEYPEGRYCYFLTVDGNGAGVYPYILGKSFYSVPAKNNFNLEFDQKNDSNIPLNARRIRTSNTPSRGFDASLVVGDVGRGSIDKFTVVESGSTFKNTDYLYLNNDDTEGSRAFGRVSEVRGKSVPRVSYKVAANSNSTSGSSKYYEIGLESWTSTHNAPILFTQALNDPTGAGNQASWLRDYINSVKEISANATVSVTTIPGPNNRSLSHAAFTIDATLQAAIRSAVGSTNPAGTITNQQYTIVPTDGETHTVDGTSYPVMGKLYVPTGLAASSIDVVVVFHGTVTDDSVTTIQDASETSLTQFINSSGVNVRDKIVFSVAYPQDHISNTLQYNLTGVGEEQSDFLMGDNLPYARAAVGWVKNSLDAYIAAQGESKTIDDVYLFGHSQGGKLVTKMNTLETGIAGVVANAPGPIQFDQTCSADGSNTSCSKVAAIHGVPGQSVPVTNGVPTSPWPIQVSAPQYANTTYDVTVETSEPHNLSNGDEVTLSLNVQAVSITKTFNVRVSDYQTITYTKPSVTTTLVADVAFNATVINIDTPDAANFRINDYIKINDEILKITAIDTGTGQLTVDRTQFNTPLRLHASTNPVSLHIPDDEPDYRLSVGGSIAAAGIAGVIYAINKENSTIDVRVTSGTITTGTTILDNSTSTGRQVIISSVSGKSVYWEIDPTGTANHYVRDFQFRLIRGTKYVFDLSDGTNLNHNLVFSEDSSNVNALANVTYIGTPGTPGATATIEKAALLNFDVSRVYYYDEARTVLNNNKFFTVLLLPAGTQTVNVVNPTKFKFTAPFQPEVPEWLNLVSYKTTSKTAVGEIFSIATIDGGEGYKKLPKVEGVTHSLLDDLRTEITFVGGAISSVKVVNGGSRYSSSTKLFINSQTGSGAKLTPTIVNEKITSITVDAPGTGYSNSDTILAVDTDAKIYAEGENIGKIRTVRFNNSGSQFTPDRTLSKSLLFNKKVIVKNLADDGYKLAEVVTTPGGFEAKVDEIRLISNGIYLLNLSVVAGELKADDILTGQINQRTSTVTYVTNPDIVGVVKAFIAKVGFFDSDLGKISSSSQKITDSNYFQDFSYVIRSTRGLSDYKQYVDETTHPLGFKLFGEVSIENDVDFDDTVTGAPFSIGLAEDPTANEVIIQLPDINVESDIVYKKYELSTINTVNIKAYGGSGAARLNFLDNQIEATKMADLSDSFDDVTATFTLSTNDGNFPTDTSNTSVLLALNEIFQEPYQTMDITGISYDAGMMTVTTDGDHGFAVTVTGSTYPDQKYVHISDVTNSVANINFNGQFEIYDVPSSNSFRATISNPNGTLTNNDPAVCADVQSTIDNLIGILTYYTANPSATRPIVNEGIWTDPTKGPVSANRHRDGANLIAANKFEIIDRANAEISIQHPDFYYPNDPQTTGYSRYKDAYRLIQLNRQEIIDGAFAEIAIQHPTFVNPNSAKCQRDIGYFIDAVSLDVHTGGNVYARKFLKQYFNAAGTSLTTNGLSGEILESVTAFNKARDLMKEAITNQLTVTDLTITPGNANYWGAAVGTPTAVTYDASTGISVITIANHGLSNGDDVLIKSNGLTFTCAMDGNVAEKSYPRLADGNHEQAMAVSNITTDTFEINVGASPLVNHQVSDVDYDPVTGDVELTIGTHSLRAGTSIKLRDESLTFTCSFDNHQTQHSYPKTTILSETIENAEYDPSTGVLTVTVDNHGWENGDFIKFDDNSVVFTCARDGNQSEHSYPRPGQDPYAGKWLPIYDVYYDTFKVKVGVSSDTSAHTFVRATENGLKKKKDKVYDTAVPIVTTTATTITINVGSSTDTSDHTFVSALSDAVISGGDYAHTFVRAVTDAIVRPVANAITPNTNSGACADVQSNIDNLVSIVTIYLNQGSLVSPLALPVESMRVPSFGEGKCKRDLGYIVDAVIADMRSGGNSSILESTEFYIDGNALLPNGISGELAESTTAFNKARDMMKLAIANQLYEKDFTILPDFLSTSGTLVSGDVANAILTEGQYEYDNSNITFYEEPKEGTTFYSKFFKFVDSADDARYSYKIKDILFDGTSTRYDLFKKNGTNVVTEPDENLLIFVDGVMQFYGESYTIDRSVNPNQIVFTKPIARDRHFFGFTFSKYKILNNFSHLLDNNRKSFELQFGEDNIIPPDIHQILVLLDGVPQREGEAFTIVDNVLTFTEAPQTGKNCHCLYFYGKTFDKTISIWNGNVFEDLEYIGNNSPDGCRYQNKVANTGDIIFPGDLIKIDGETPKEIIRIDNKALENTDNLLYTAFVYTDNSYIRGKNAVANATITGVPVSGGNTVGIQNTVGVSGTYGIPTVFEYVVTGAQITNEGLEYDVAPEVIFKTTCDNPGTGAKGYAEITNGKVTNVVITDGGSGYNAAPEIIFAKKYEIIRPHTPLFAKKDVIIDYTAIGGNAGLRLGVSNESEVEDILPLVVSQITSETIKHLQTQLDTPRDVSQPGLAYNLNTFDQLKFQFEPLELNDPLANYLGTGVTIEHMTRYSPNITIGDFTTHAGVSYGSAGGAIINLPLDAYVSYGLTLNGAINDAVTTITVTGNVANFPPSGYLEFGDEIMEYTSISGQDFTVVRGAKSTTASAHTDGDYLRLAWRG